MAGREGQGLQIAVIIFVMVSVVLALTTFFFYRDAEEARKTAADALSKQKIASDSAAKENFKNQYFLHILGEEKLSKDGLDSVMANLAADETIQKVEKSFQDAMSTFGEGLPPEEQNFKQLPRNLIIALAGRNRDITRLTSDLKKNQDKSDKMIEDEQKIAEAAKTDMQKANDDLATARVDFNTETTRIRDDNTSLKSGFETARTKLQSQLALESQKLTQRQADIKKLNTVIEDQTKTIVEMRDEPFEVADGRIAWVNQASMTVWINLGLADGLRRQTLFSVYDKAENGVSRSERKASIEVTKVLDQHLAEARIVRDAAADPILPGDQVFSPAWRPGRKVRFALAGKFDIDGDRRSDRDLIRNLITMSGAVIDAEIHDDGTVEGELSTSTRYLVRGDRPTDGSDSKTLAAYSTMIGKASEYGVEVIPIDKLLSWMGYNPEVRTLGLGNNADPSQFKIPPAEGRARESSGNVSDKFRERQPPVRGKDGSTYE